MMLGLLLGATVFLVVAYVGEKNALYMPALVLLFAAAASVLGGSVST